MYLKNEDRTIPFTNLFYVQLYNEDDYSLLADLSDSLGADIVIGENMDRNWVILRNTNKERTSIETANKFWETGFFKNIDYGFGLKFGLNDNPCVTDASFDQQWNMDVINACTAWST